MNTFTRRDLLGSTAGLAGLASLGSLTRAAAAAAAPAALGDLKSLTADAKPITAAERQTRIAKLQALMTQGKVSALLVESGSTLEYFTGIQWRRSERTTAAVIPARGEVVVVTPAFEEPSVRETLQVGGDVRPWNEADNPFELIAQAIKDRASAAGAAAGRASAGRAGPRGLVAIEPTTRFFIVDGLRRAAPACQLMSGDALVRECRLIKSPAELSLLQTANDVTLAALHFVHGRVERGMTAADLAQLMDAATAALGAGSEFSLVLLNEASAYPHGSKQPQAVHDGSVILMDCGCNVHGYQSDISRTWVYGEPTVRQRQVWTTVKRGQEITLETAKSGVPTGALDDAVRKYYESQGWGPGYRLPGLPHRTGHGIGLDGHEAAYLVHGDATPLRPGMCFSDEPGLYIPGEFGIRLEDCWHMTESGPKTFTPLAKSLEDPI